MSQKLVNYDGFDYDYSTYWEGREYENAAEHIVVEKLLKEEKGDWFIDIGGSYGRLADSYADRYRKCIILDYSLKTLMKNQDHIIKRFPNCILIAANAYRMPFEEDVFDGSLMVRVLHHIQNQKEYFNELARVLKKDGIYIQEFANKRHLKARVRAFFSGNRSINDEKPYQQPTIHLEGAKGGGVSFLNYHPKHIERLLEESGFEIIGKQGCSYLRVPLFKRLFGINTLLFFERILQKVFSKSDIPPSIFFKSKLNKGSKGKDYENLKDILLCPSCKGSLDFGDDICICSKCKKKYIKGNGIWDFRTE